MPPVTRRSALALLCAPSAGAVEAHVVSCRKIWDRAPHNAFTDLVRFRGRWFCAFREGEAHASPGGALRVLVSDDGERWKPAALLAARGDLRDAKLSVLPGGRLALGGAIYHALPDPVRLQSLVWFSGDGRAWSKAQPAGDPEFWLWRTTWHGERGYCIGYNTNPNRNLRTIRLYQTQDGARYDTVVEDLGVRNSPGENTIRFQQNGTAVCLLRRDAYRGEPPIPASAATALQGVARPPYLLWEWKDLGVTIGGPNFIEAPGGGYVAALRLVDGKSRTSLCRLDTRAGTLREFLTLPSGGDTGYPGLVWHDGLLWVSYYSSHEGKASIYLARVSLPSRAGVEKRPGRS